VAAIKTLKNSKSPGQDNLGAELFKADSELAADILQPLFTAAWKNEKVPDDWTKGVIVKIPKKRTLSDCNNWRGITLLSVPSKILAKVIIRRILDAVDDALRKEQAGFREQRGCIDQIFTLRNIIEQCTEWQRQLYVNLWTSKRHLTAYTETAFGVSFDTMASHRNWYTLSRASTTTSDALWAIATLSLKSRLE